MANAVSNESVMRVFELCSHIYADFGLRIKFPEGTDPTKTYHWRYAGIIAQQLQDWEFDEATTDKFIRVAVGYAKSNGLLAKGLSLLCQKNLLKVCYDKLQAECSRAKSASGSLADSAQWVSAQVGSKDVVKTMLRRERAGGYCNLVRWFTERRVSALYLALSKSASKAMMGMSPSDRAALPSQSSLYLLRTEFTKNEDNRAAAKLALGGDCKKCL